jgi:hypothetical protein
VDCTAAECDVQCVAEHAGEPPRDAPADHDGPLDEVGAEDVPGDADAPRDEVGAEDADSVDFGLRESCSNLVDDDGDTLVDCADRVDCEGAGCGANGRTCSGGACVCPGGTMETSCSNGVDDDCDGMADCADPECEGALCGMGAARCSGGVCLCPGGVSETNCSDGADNDCDTAFDCADPDCDGVVCGAGGRRCSGGSCGCSGTAETSCMDGADNDCDTATDCADSDCNGQPCGISGYRCSGGACRCPGGTTETSCADVADNDCDTRVDCADSDCNGASCGTGGRTCSGGVCGCGGTAETSCLDRLDNDCDGAIDCADAECDRQRCGDDGTVCGGVPKVCHVCGGGVCALDSSNYDAFCRPSCGELDRLCPGSATTCCSAVATCPGGVAGETWDCARCCFGSCGCTPGELPERTCGDGVDNDCDGSTDCADPDCNLLRCANDGTVCGAYKECHWCSGGVCALNSSHYDASCRPSCGEIDRLCPGAATICCPAGSACSTGDAGESWDCARCCYAGCS